MKSFDSSRASWIFVFVAIVGVNAAMADMTELPSDGLGCITVLSFGDDVLSGRSGATRHDAFARLAGGIDAPLEPVAPALPGGDVACSGLTALCIKLCATPGFESPETAAIYLANNNCLRFCKYGPRNWISPVVCIYDQANEHESCGVDPDSLLTSLGADHEEIRAILDGMVFGMAIDLNSR